MLTRKLKKVAVTILAFAICLTLLPDAAFAKDYGITVCGVTVTSDNKDDVLGDRTVSYDAERNILTLDGAELSYNSTVIDADNTDLTITGSGTVSSSDSSAIYVREGDLTLDGDFTLSSGDQSAVFVTNGNNLTVNGGTIKAECTGNQNTICVGGALTVNGGTLHSKSTTGKNALSVRMINLNTDNGIQFLQGDEYASEVLIGAYVEYPIYVCYVQVTSANAGNVLAGDEANDGRVKYDAEKKTLTLDGAELSNTGKCISANGTDLTIEGSGTISSSSGNAIIVEGDLTLDGDFTLSSGGQSTVLVTIGNNLTVNGGTIEAECTGGQTTIYVGGDLTVKDGTLHSKSTTGHYAINAREITLNEENGIRFLLGYENASEVLIGAYVEYPISVCGVDVTSANAGNILKGDEANDGRVKYNAATNTLTLDNAKLEYDGDCIYVEYNTDLTIKGSAEIHNLSSIAIYLDQGNLTLDGDFTVTTDSGPTAISVLAMTVNGGTLYAKSNAADGCALYTPMGLTLNEEKGIQFLQGDIGSSEILIGAKVEYPVKVCGVKVTSANAGNVLAGDAKNDGRVKYDAATKILTLDGAELVEYANDCISSNGTDLTITGSGTLSSSGGCAIYINNGDLTLDGDFTLSSGYQFALLVEFGSNLTVNGGTIEAECTGNQIAISVGGELTVIDGTLHSKSTTGNTALYAMSINLNEENGIQFLQGDEFASEVLIGAKYPLEVCGVKVTSANAGNVLAGGDNDNKVKYDAATKTLTLDNAKLSSTMNSCILTDNADLTIKGSGTISSSSGNAIIVEGDLTLDGDFTLFSSVQNAVYVGGGLTVNGGKIEAESAGNQNTISVGRDLTVNGGTLHSKSTTGERALSVRSINLNTDNGIQFLQGDASSSEVLIGAKAPATLKKDEQGRYMIGTAADLDEFSALVNGGEMGAKAILTADITYTGKNWTPIGTDSTYSGTFDGGGHTITGLSNEEAETAPEYAGLFGGNGGIVKNVIIENGYIKGSEYAGGIAGNNSRTIENCIFSGTVTAAGKVVFAGGIAGYNSKGIENCVNTAAVNATGSNSAHSGGIAGETNGNGSIKNCLNHGDVTASGDLNIEAGGIAGFNNGTIDSCVNTGAAEGKRAGGIAGRNNEAVKNCLNIGAVTATEGGKAGGVIGLLDFTNASVECCLNIGETAGGKYNGGIVGDTESSSIENCFSINTADGNLIGQNRGSTTGAVRILSLEEFADQSSFTCLDFSRKKIWVMGDNYPIITALSQKVTFYANNGTDTAAEQYVIKTYETALRENTFKYDGHTFTGWNDKTDGTGSVSFDDKAKVTLTGDITLYGQWEEAATAPTITSQPPKTKEITYGYKNETLSVTAQFAEGDTPSYQWYQCADTDKNNRAAIEGATAAEFTIPEGADADTVLGKFYFCVVRATKGDKYAQTESDVTHVTIKQKTVTIKIDDKEKEFGDPDPEFTATVEGLVGDDTIENYVLYRENTSEEINEYEISVPSYYDFNKSYPNYNISVEKGKLTITKRTVTVTAVDKQKVYGEEDPELEYSVAGIEGAEINKLGKITVAIEDNHDNAGEYTITPTVENTDLEEYKVTCVTGKFSITPKPVTVTAVDKEKAYGDPDPDLTVKAEGLVGDDKLYDCTVTRAVGEKLGEYEINAEIKAKSNPNYKITVKKGTFTIKRRPVTVTADDKEKTYRGTEPELTAKVEGLLENEGISYTLSRAEGDNVGEYTITPEGDEVQGNYRVTYKTGKLTVKSAGDVIVTITGHKDETVYDGAEHSVQGYDVEISNNIYTAEDFTFSGNAVAAQTNAGTKDMGLTAAQFVNNNQNFGTVTFNVKDGKQTITRKAVKVTAENKEKTYGDSDPELTAKVEGLLGSDKVSYGFTREGGENAGSYKISPTGDAEQGNYAVSFAEGKLTVGKRAATVTAEDKEKYYRTADPELTATTEGVMEGDSLDYTVTREEGETAGTYEITVTPGDNPNYDLTVNGGRFTITARKASTNTGTAGSVPQYKAEVKTPGNGKVLLSDDSAPEGKTVIVTLVPDEGFRTEKLTVTDENGKNLEITKDEQGILSFKMPAFPVTVDAVFAKAAMENTDFTDVDANLWYYEYVKDAVESGLMKGTGKNTFEPEKAIDRATVITVLYRMEGEPKAGGAPGFKDVTAGEWYADAVIWGVEKGIVYGFEDESFRPDAEITREQLAAILYRYAGFKGFDISKKADLSGYADAALISEWAKDAMSWAVAEEYITGRTETALVPDGTATRAEAAAIFARFSMVAE